MIHFKKTSLDNGIRVVSELHPNARGVSIGIWVLTGTRDEERSQAGISHFLEHLVFKGTKTRSAYQLAKSLESLGGELNAYTTREYTCYHATVLKDHWKKGLEVLSDLVSNMSINRADFALEKNVILQEISMGEDALEELIYDLYFEKALPKSTLGLPILGVPETVQAMTQKKIFDYYKRNYSGQNMIVSAAGCLDHQSLVEGVQEFLGHKPKKRVKNDRVKPKHKAFRQAISRESEQLHLLVGFPCSSFKDRNRFDAFVVNALLGGGMTSKLYQSVREKRGLVYSIYSSLNTFDDFGLINVYASCEPQNMKAVVKNIVSSIKKIKREGVSESELEMFKTQVSGGVLLGADDIDNRMTSLGVNEMVFSKYKPVEAIEEEISKVTTKSVKEFIKRYLNLEDSGWLLIGNKAEEFESLLKEIK